MSMSASMRGSKKSRPHARSLISSFVEFLLLWTDFQFAHVKNAVAGVKADSGDEREVPTQRTTYRRNTYTESSGRSKGTRADSCSLQSTQRKATTLTALQYRHFADEPPRPFSPHVYQFGWGRERITDA